MSGVCIWIRRRNGPSVIDPDLRRTAGLLADQESVVAVWRTASPVNYLSLESQYAGCPYRADADKGEYPPARRDKRPGLAISRERRKVRHLEPARLLFDVYLRTAGVTSQIVVFGAFACSKMTPAPSWQRRNCGYSSTSRKFSAHP